MYSCITRKITVLYVRDTTKWIIFSSMFDGINDIKKQAGTCISGNSYITGYWTTVQTDMHVQLHYRCHMVIGYLKPTIASVSEVCSRLITLLYSFHCQYIAHTCIYGQRHFIAEYWALLFFLTPDNSYSFFDLIIENRLTFLQRLPVATVSCFCQRALNLCNKRSERDHSVVISTHHPIYLVQRLSQTGDFSFTENSK